MKSSGSKHWKAKLTDAQVRDMRDLRQRLRKSYGVLGQIFDCGASTARDIVTYATRIDA